MPSSYDVIHNENYEIELCDINTDDLVLETTVDETDLTGLGHIKITIYSSEAYGYPHFHIIKNTKERVSCICIFEPRYFVHGEYRSTLNSKQRKQLDYALRMPNQNNQEKTNWEFIRDFWLTKNDINGIYKNKARSKQPDYTKLREFIQE